MEGRSGLLNQIRGVFDGEAVAGLTDERLIERFTQDQGPSSVAAFSAIVERHGPMVMRVCRASLCDEHAAEDAFQAVFLVLVRKAKSLWVRDSLGPWLHQVAVRTSLAARGQANRRRLHEKRRAEAFVPSETPSEVDLVPVIHEELGRLPDHYRQAMVLCDMDGLSHQEAAARLGWPIGTVKSRQARGRERIRDRLRRRGLDPVDASFATAFALKPVALEIVATTVESMNRAKLGLIPVSSSVVLLSQTVLKGMMMKRIFLGLLSIVVVTTLALGMISITRGHYAEEKPAAVEPSKASVTQVPPSGPRPPAGSVFELRILADLKHDGAIGDRAGYRWVKLHPKDTSLLDDLVVREDKEKMRVVAVKTDPQNLTERDFLEVKKVKDERDQVAISFKMTPDGSRRLGELTRAHLPEDAGNFKYRLAIIVEGVAVAMPSINSEVRNAGMIQFGPPQTAEDIDRIFKLLTQAAAYNAPTPKAKRVKDQAEAIREALQVDLPALNDADLVTIESPTRDATMQTRIPKTLNAFRTALRPRDVPPSGGEKAATIKFYHQDELIRTVWVYEGGEWGFERPGTSWTTGSDAELWGLVKSWLPK